MSVEESHWWSASACELYRETIQLGLSRGRNAMGIWQDPRPAKSHRLITATARWCETRRAASTGVPGCSF